jgi:hypothetical protein
MSETTKSNTGIKAVAGDVVEAYATAARQAWQGSVAASRDFGRLAGRFVPGLATPPDPKSTQKRGPVPTKTKEVRRDVRSWDDCAGPSLTGAGHYGRRGCVEPIGTNLK